MQVLENSTFFTVNIEHIFFNAFFVLDSCRVFFCNSGTRILLLRARKMRVLFIDKSWLSHKVPLAEHLQYQLPHRANNINVTLMNIDNWSVRYDKIDGS